MNAGCHDDAALVERASSGDPQAFDALWRRYRDHVRRAVRCVAPGDAECDDALQDAAIRAWCALRSGGYKHSGRFRGWLVTIGINAARDCARRAPRVVPLETIEQTPACSAPSPETAAIIGVLWRTLESELDECLASDRTTSAGRDDGLIRRMAFVWYYADGLPLDDVAALVAAEYVARGRRPPGRAAVNSWLGGGRLLTKLVSHLVDHHADMVERLVEPAAASEAESARAERRARVTRLVAEIAEDLRSARTGR